MLTGTLFMVDESCLNRSKVAWLLLPRVEHLEVCLTPAAPTDTEVLGLFDQ